MGRQSTISLANMPIGVPFEIIGCSSSVGPLTTTTEQVVEQLIENGADSQFANVQRIVGGVGRSMLPRIESGQVTETLALDAASQAVDFARDTHGLDPKSIGVLIFTTSTPRYLVPESSKELHAKLGLSANCHTFTLSNACQGGVDGLLVAASMLNSYPHNSKAALVVAADVTSTKLARADADTNGIFSDMATAVVIKQNSKHDSGLLFHAVMTDSLSRGNFIVETDQDSTIKMDGKAVARTVMRLVPQVVDLACLVGKDIFESKDDQDPKVWEFDLSQLSLLVSHQSSSGLLSITKSILAKRGIDPGKVPDIFHDFGNASAPTTLNVLRVMLEEGRLQKGDYFGMLSAAVGSSAVLGVFKY